MTKLTTAYHAIRDKTIEAGLFFGTVLTALPSRVMAQEEEGIDAGLGGGRDALKPKGEDSGDGGLGETFFEDGEIFQTVTNFILFLVGAIAVIMLIIGGFKYVISGGDSTKVESAKNTIIYAIVGIVVAFLAWAAVDFVIGTLDSAQDNAS